MLPQFNQNIPSVKELWKDEKSKYRHWIVILGLGILLTTSLTLASFIMNILNASSIKADISESLNKTYKNVTEAMVNGSFQRIFIIFPAIQLFAMFTGLVLYIGGTYNSYKEKNFARLSGWPTLVVGLGAFLAFINIVQALFTGNTSSLFSSPSSLFSFISSIIFIVVYFAASAPVSRLRRVFIISERMEKMKNDPQFQAMQQQISAMLQGQGGAMGPFGPATGAAQGAAPKTGQGTPTQPGQTVTPQQPQENPTKKKLDGMTVTQLKEVAKELSISGYQSMKKQELIDAILRISNNE